MICAPFAAYLEAERDALNRRVQDARRLHPAFDPEAFVQFLATCADPVVAAAPPHHVNAVARAAYDVAVDLAAVGLTGAAAGSRELAATWREAAPALVAALVEHPGQVLSMLSNAAVHLASYDGVRVSRWNDELAAIAPMITTVAQLQTVGQICAWRAGLAHFRSAAITAADGLPAPLACVAFGAGGEHSWPAIRAQLRASPWWAPGTGNSITQTVGRFAGLGGRFMRPPEVLAHADGFAVRSGEHYFMLVVDTFGAVLQAATHEAFSAPLPVVRANWHLQGAVLNVGAQNVELNLPPEGLAACANPHTIAVTSPYTHSISLFAIQ